MGNGIGNITFRPYSFALTIEQFIGLNQEELIGFLGTIEEQLSLYRLVKSFS